MRNRSFYTKIYLFFIAFMSWFGNIQASHLQGADITYTCLGGNQYEIALAIVWDCNGITPSDTMMINFTSPSCGGTFSKDIYKVASQTGTNICPSAISACNGSSIYGWENYLYKDTITLTGNCPDWKISWSSCCRNSAITTLPSPGSSGLYVFTLLDASLSSCNSSPKFIETFASTLLIGVNSYIYLNYGAIDADGDSLVYSFDNALSYFNFPVGYTVGLSGTNPLVSAYTSINSSTGMITLLPTTYQMGVIAVKVEEYRNGVKIGEIRRDMLATVTGGTGFSNSTPIVSSVNGIAVTNSNTIPITTTVGDTVDLNLNINDPDVTAGNQTLTAIWDNMPMGVLASGGSTPSFSWTPTGSDIGIHNVYLTILDNGCPFMGNSSYAFQITVQDTNTAPIAINDTFYINKYESKILNLTLNDLDANGDHLILDSIMTNYSNTNSYEYILTDSTVQYVPVTGISEVDSFKYRVCDNQNPSLCSEATVYLVVPKVIYHQAAAGASTTITLDSTGLGKPMQSIIHVGGFLNNATFPVSNLNIPEINLTADSIAIDTVTVMICDSLFIDSTTTCVYNVVILDVQQGVWPGDTDTSQLVNHFDLLNIGFAYGNTGTPRSPASIVWDGYLTPDWTKVMPVSNINFKHIDCNGDGIIDTQDTVAIAANWNKNYTYRKSGSGVIPFYIDTIAPTSYNTSLPIILGTSTIPANDIYGLAFTITYDTALVKPNTVDISIDTSWLGTAGTNLISIHKDFYNDGMVQVAITRTDGADQDGFGKIGSLDFTIQDDIMLRGAAPKFFFNIEGVKAIDEQENPIYTNPQPTDFTFFTTNTEALNLNHLVKVFPNPTSNILNIQCKDLTIERVTLTNMAGQIVKEKFLNTYQTTLSTNDLSNGVYRLSILTDKGLIHQKVSILK